MQALAGEKRAKVLGKSERERKLHDTCVKRYTRRKVSGDCFLRVFKKTRLSDEAFEDLYKNTV